MADPKLEAIKTPATGMKMPAPNPGRAVPTPAKYGASPRREFDGNWAKSRTISYPRIGRPLK